MFVSKLMTPHPLIASPDDTVGDALGVMLRNDIHALPVVRDGVVVGIVSRRDVQIAIGPGVKDLDPDTMNGEGLDLDVESVMSTDVETLAPHDTVADACRTLVATRVGALPVLDANGKLVGILSVTDVLAAAARLFERV